MEKKLDKKKKTTTGKSLKEKHAAEKKQPSKTKTGKPKAKSPGAIQQKAAKAAVKPTMKPTAKAKAVGVENRSKVNAKPPVVQKAEEAAVSKKKGQKKLTAKNIEKIIRDLTNKGRKKGFVTDAEIKSIFPSEPSPKALNALYDFLAEKNIEIVDTVKTDTIPPQQRQEKTSAEAPKASASKKSRFKADKKALLDSMPMDDDGIDE